MHELSLVESLLTMVQQYAAQENFQHVISLRLSMGRFSGVVEEALRFAFDVQSQGTIAEGATLEIEVLPAAVYCFECEQEVEIASFEAICPICRGSSVILVRGTEELKLIELEVEP
ncbi:MAG TPA: hydrogenase maturation nickel metallochaperone HypA [Syntrophales bacterium]|nr:hydrogenase maturation nickel metallochaperone HypA [Syntrophales bacterium]HOL60005.1 hydrogenase maturation nickel metallochaperone HypA [Syntrophales bacterium]HPO36144.1 hydrogenase maturation nickel metallochaperone HypA [Syntrophales bacterium]